MLEKNFFISEDEFRVWLPEVAFIEKSDNNDSFNSRKIKGIMSTQRKDRQGEVLISKGLDFSEFLSHGHFNDNHSQDTSAIIGYPEKVEYHNSLKSLGLDAPGWTCEGYVLKGTKRADAIWELAKALQGVPNRKLGFSVEGKVERRADKTIEKAKIRHVAITNCFPGDTKVVGAANKVTKRFYSGEMVEIELATGEKISATPNHPIFTQRGWVAIGELDKANDLVGRFDSDLAKSAPTSKVSNNINNVPSTFEEIFNAGLVSGNSFRVGQTGKGNFHGDGTASDVDIVLAEGELRDALHSSFFEKFGKEALVCSDKQESFLFNLRLKFKLAIARLAASTGFISSKSEFLSLARASFGVSDSVGLHDVSGKTIPFGNLPDTLSGHSVFGGDKGSVLSSSIGFANIKFKRVFNFFGHVFNLDTTHGWYDVNGIVAHNCPVNTDCTWEVLEKSFHEPELAIKSMMAGYGVSPGSQTGGGALRSESLDSDAKKVSSMEKKKKKKLEALMRALDLNDMMKAMDIVLDKRPDFDEDTAAIFVRDLFNNKRGGNNG